MAYKFQLGDAVMSGSLTQEEGVITTTMSASSDVKGFALWAGGQLLADSARKVTSTNLSSSGPLRADGATELNGTVKLPGVVDTAAAVASDSFYFKDSDGTMKSESMADYATAVAGDGLGAVGGVLKLSLDELTEAAIASGDYVGFQDVNDSGQSRKDTIDDIATLFAGNGLAAASAVLSVDLNELAGGAIASGDSFAFTDANDSNISKKESIDDLATLFAGDGLAAASAVLAVQVSGAVKIASDKVGVSGSVAGAGLTYTGGVDSILTLEVGAGSLIDVTADAIDVDLSEAAAASVANGDNFIFLDGGASGTAAKGDVADLATLFAGIGLSAASSVMALDLNELNAAAVDVAADSIAIIDANDSNGSRKESIVDLVAAMAGGGLSASGGQLSTQANAVTSYGDASVTLAEGMNYGTAQLSADRTLTLPAAPTVGDVIHVKAPNNLAGFRLIISRAGTQTIDGAVTIDIESADGAVSLMYVAANLWKIW